MCDKTEDTPATCSNADLEPNKNYKDSVFVDLHSEDKLLRKQAVIDIYNALHDEKFTINEEIRYFPPLLMLLNTFHTKLYLNKIR